MKPSVKGLGEVLFAPSQYVIPVFQRNYRWERPQWEKFWFSVMEIGEPEKTGNHFMGFLVFVPGLAQPGQHTRFHLIDGQQRLTTSCLLLAALRNVARSTGQAELAEEIHNDYLVHPRKTGDEHYRLLPKQRDQASFVAIVESRPVAGGRMSDALVWFEEQVSKPRAGLSLRLLFNVICQRLEFMCATLETENAYNIFKSLNSTGVPLGPSDLIRNFVFMHVTPDDQDDFDRDHWAPLEAMYALAGKRLDDEAFSRFFRDYLMMGGRYVQPRDTFATFESRYEATDFLPRALADELLMRSRDYATINGRNADIDPAVTGALRELNLLESSTTYPLLLALFQRREKAQIKSAELAYCIQMLRGFILRRFICGDSSRGYGQMFARALVREDGDTVAALEAYLLDRGWPDDRRFVEAFVLFPLYKRGYGRQVLESLERARGHKEQATLDAAQIEHVMPQTLRPEWHELLGDEAERIHADWLHQPGNLTLSAYNQELGNQSFVQKQVRFAQSNIVLTRELADIPTWGEQLIRSRGEAMAKSATALWIGPKEPHQQRSETDASAGGGSIKPAGANGSEREPAKLRQQRFWGVLAKAISSRDTHLRPQKPLPQHWTTYAIGRSGFAIAVTLNSRGDRIGVELAMSSTTAKQQYKALLTKRAQIEAQLGFLPEWQELPNRLMSRVISLRDHSPLDEASRWPEYVEWIVERMLRMDEVFRPLVRALP